jgi:hypothetical protein
LCLGSVLSIINSDWSVRILDVRFNCHNQIPRVAYSVLKGINIFCYVRYLSAIRTESASSIAWSDRLQNFCHSINASAIPLQQTRTITMTLRHIHHKHALRHCLYLLSLHKQLVLLPHDLLQRPSLSETLCHPSSLWL